MARTAEAIRADLATQHPKIRELHGDRLVVLDPNDPATADEYGARLDQWAARLALDETIADEQAAQKTRRQQVRTALTQMSAARTKLAVTAADRQGFSTLPLWTAATAAQKSEILRLSTDEVLQDLAGLIQVFIDRGDIEGESAEPIHAEGA